MLCEQMRLVNYFSMSSGEGGGTAFILFNFKLDVNLISKVWVNCLNWFEIYFALHNNCKFIVFIS